jgi:hypothetical protein
MNVSMNIVKRLAPLLATVLATFVAPAASARERFDTRVLARVPDPGSVALTVLGGDRTIYGGTFFPAAGNAGDGTPSRLFAWAPDGRLLHAWTIAGQDLAADHGLQATVVDAVGHVYLLDTSPARVIVFDPRSGGQRTYATIPDLRPCSGASRSGCSASLVDNPPEPDYAAWGPDGSLYVTDDTQATIFRVPPGGGAARPWLTDPRFDFIAFGLTGLALAPDRRTLVAAAVGSSPLAAADPAAGSLVAIPIDPNGSPGTPRVLWRSGQAEAPDGFAFARSGDIYVALVGPVAHQIVELSPGGRELARFPSAADNALRPVPFDTPSSVVFDGSRLLVTNLSYFADDRAHQVIFDVEAGEPGAPLFVPSAPAAARPRLRLRVLPRILIAGRRVRLDVWIRLLGGGPSATLPRGAAVQLGGHSYNVGPHGRVTVTVRFARAGRVPVRATARGALAARLALIVRPPVRHARPRE